MTKQIFVYKTKKHRKSLQIFFAKDLLEGVTTFPRIDNAQSCSFLELSCLYLKRILEMKHRRVQTLFVEETRTSTCFSIVLSTCYGTECCHQIEDN